MTPRPLIVVGGGEHARVVIDAARSRPDLWTLRGFVDPAPCETTAVRLAVPRLGGDEVLAAAGPELLVLGLGMVGISDQREALVGRLPGRAWATVVHAAAWVSSAATLGEGAVVLAGAVVNAGAQVGPHAIVNSGALVEHDVELGAYAHVGPGAAIGGGAIIGPYSYLGLRASVRDHVRLGARVLVGMGAAVTRSAADGARLLGVPARAVPEEGQ